VGCPYRKKIDVAVRSGFLPCDRSKQVQPSHPDPMKIGFVVAKGRDHVASIHLPSPNAGITVPFSECRINFMMTAASAFRAVRAN
jgi:hypothetical protein